MQSNLVSYFFLIIIFHAFAPKLNGGSFMKCPVCHDVQVDPCTLSCGHTTCQLCLAHMWDNGNHSCPVCKTSWQVIPAISIEYRYIIRSVISYLYASSHFMFYYREQIEKLYSKQETQRRKQYTEDEKDLIKRLLSGKVCKEDSTLGLSLC